MNLHDFYLNSISNNELKNGFKWIYNYFERSNAFRIELYYKESLKLKDVQFFCNIPELNNNFGRINHPFSMVIYPNYFSFYVRGKSNVFRSEMFCNKFENCHKNPAGEPIITIKKQSDAEELFKYIFEDKLGIKSI